MPEEKQLPKATEILMNADLIWFGAPLLAGILFFVGRALYLAWH